MERDEDSTTTLQVLLLVATTFIFTFSLNGEIQSPRRASTINNSSLHFTLQNLVCFSNSRFIAV